MNKAPTATHARAKLISFDFIFVLLVLGLGKGEDRAVSKCATHAKRDHKTLLGCEQNAAAPGKTFTFLLEGRSGLAFGCFLSS